MPDHAAPLPDWTLVERLAWVGRFRRAVAASADELCRLMEAEVGKPAWEGLTGDIMPLLASCRWHERHARRVLEPRVLRGRAVWQVSQRSRVERVPLGRVAIIATWNYPVQLLGVQLVQTLVGGNAAVVKPSERSLSTQAALLGLALGAGLPSGALEARPATREAGAAMLAEHGWDHVVFTGSTAVGRRIAAALAPGLTPSTLELSGRDSALVLADADAGRAARSIWHAVTLNAGQTCMAPRRVLVEAGAAEAFLLALSPLAAGARPMRLIDSEAASRAFALVRGALDRGARSLSGVVEPPDGPMLRPVALADCLPDAEIVQGEHFAPVLPVVQVGSIDEALAIHHQCDQHLATSVFTRSVWRGRDLARRLAAGTVVINDCVLPTAHPAAALQGVGASGWGASRGEGGLLAMTRPVHVASTGALRVPTEAPEPSTARRLGEIVRRWYARGPVAPETPRIPTMHLGGARSGSHAAGSTRPTAHGVLP